MFFFVLLFSSLHCCTLLHSIALLNMLIFFSPYCFPLHNTTFLFALLLSSSHCLTFIFALLLSFSAILLFQVQGSSCCCFFLCIVFFSSLCCCCWCVVIHWRILYYPPSFLLARIGNGWESKIGNQYFFHKYFPFAYFHFLI